MIEKSITNKQSTAFLKKKQKLLLTAARLVIKKGFSAMSMNDLATQVGITKASLYHYYSNKDDIALEIERLNFETVQNIFAGAEENCETGLEKLEYFFLAYSQLMTTPVGAAGVQIASIPHSQELKKRYTVFFKEVDSKVRKYMLEGQKDGSIADMNLKWADFIMFGALHSIPKWYSSKAGLNPEQLANELFEVLMSGFRPR